VSTGILLRSAEGFRVLGLGNPKQPEGHGYMCVSLFPAGSSLLGRALVQPILHLPELQDSGHPELRHWSPLQREVLRLRLAAERQVHLRWRSRGVVGLGKVHARLAFSDSLRVRARLALCHFHGTHSRLFCIQFGQCQHGLRRLFAVVDVHIRDEESLGCVCSWREFDKNNILESFLRNAWACRVSCTALGVRGLKALNLHRALLHYPRSQRRFFPVRVPFQNVTVLWYLLKEHVL